MRDGSRFTRPGSLAWCARLSRTVGVVLVSAGITRSAVAAEILVEVTNGGGTALPGVLVSAAHDNGTNRWIITGDDGSGQLRNLGQGRWVLTFEHEAAPPLAQPVELVSGDDLVLMPIALGEHAGRGPASGDASPPPASAPAALPGIAAPTSPWWISAGKPVIDDARSRVSRRGWRHGRAANQGDEGHRGDAGVTLARLDDRRPLWWFEDFWSRLFACFTRL